MTDRPRKTMHESGEAQAACRTPVRSSNVRIPQLLKKLGFHEPVPEILQDWKTPKLEEHFPLNVISYRIATQPA